ncbi:MAG: aldehyde dehydrogenase [Ectothiorhodospiraceae bacterium]|nr:aldehyde dehydrogenase [Chromatiales bacterium]MCP5157660.1 aldehyde dehydrogenase [Ectothiorhodospiraceae bacterium]
MQTNARLARRPAVQGLLRDRGDLLVVAGLGSAIWDVESAGENPLNFYLLGAMGSVVPTALGLALAQPSRRVLALGGDAEVMMMVGALATVGLRRPPNLAVVVLDNERFGETGKQASHTGSGIDIAGIAESCGLPTVRRVLDQAGLDELRGLIHRGPGPVFASVKIAAEMPPVVMPIRNGAIGMARFREALLGHEALKV